MTERQYLLNKLKLVTERMFETRPKKEICYRLFTDNAAIKRNFRQTIEIDMKKLHPCAKNGDICYAETDLLVDRETEINLVVRGNTAVYFNGKAVLTTASVQEFESAVINAKAGKNKVIFECECTDEGFGCEFKATHILEPSIWANDILLWVRDTFPVDEYCMEQGIAVSKLYGRRCIGEYEEDSEKYIFPPKSETDSCIDFNKLYTGGNIAAAVSYAVCDAVLEFDCKGRAAVYVNNKKTPDFKVSVKKGDEIKVVAEKTSSGWGFSCKTENLYIPFLHSRRENGAHWLIIGAFESEKDIEKVQFTKPYTAAGGKKTFWRTAQSDTYLRPYMDSCFFAQWTYALMVGEYGILNASEYIDGCFEYFYESMSVMVDYFDYINFERDFFGNTTFMPRAAQLINLDAIGAAGMMLCELYKREESVGRRKEIIHIIRCLEDKLYNKIPRTENGIFYRVQTMWADDTFMSCPFLVRLGEITGEKKHYEEAVKQLLGYRDILFMEKEELYSHIYYPPDGDRNNIPWGRGNGWVFFAMEDALEHIPKETDGYKEIAGTLTAFAHGLKKVQSESGMWRQVLNKPDTYLETSATCIFAIGMMRGARNGLLAKEYEEAAEKAVSDMLDRMVDAAGNIDGVCRGSQCSREVKYYERLSTNRNDDHGTGLVMTALCEMIKNIDKSKGRV